jgi:large subunit ribosomal protein L17
MFRNMVTSLLKYEKIQTTDAKAKALRAWVDHIITLAKKGDLHARRQALAIVREKNVVHKLFAEAIEKFGGRNGGYTRIIKIGRRAGDAAPVSMMELIISEEVSAKKGVKKKESPIIAPTIDDKGKEADQMPADKIIPSADEKASEKVEGTASKAMEEDAGVQVDAPVHAELSQTKTVDGETRELQKAQEKNPDDDMKQEERK